MIKILGIDPGKSTGYSLIEVVGRIIKPTGKTGILENESVTELQPLIREATYIICEDFLVRPEIARKGRFDYNNMVAPRVIGKIEMLCELEGKLVVKQPASLKPVAYGFANLPYKKGKANQHWKDAHAHACYFAVARLDALPVNS